MTIKFRDLKIGDKFECWGDQCINYNYPKLCMCEKLEEDVAQEIDGIKFGIHPGTEVLLIEEK